MPSHEEHAHHAVTPQVLQEFDRLQQKLEPMWKAFGGFTPMGEIQEDNTVVVVPSLSGDVDIDASALPAYEERMLFMLFLLRQPNIRLIYVTSRAIQPAIIDYYLDTLPGTIISSARKRLHLVSPQDGSGEALSHKLLDRPALIQHIRSLIPDPERAHLVPFNTTDLERELAVRLGIPMYAADPRFYGFGTKSGCRRIFAEEGIRHPLGYEDLNSADDLIDAIARIRAEHPEAGSVIAKLNEGVSGIGNAVIDLSDLPDPGASDEAAAIRERLPSMRFEVDDITYDDYIEKLEERGAVVEEYIRGDEMHSPSAQLRATPLGDVELLSTHDQMLGGPSGQSYLGAIFPADPAYSALIMHDAAVVGRRFAKEGIVGRFALDFVVVRKPDGGWQSYAIEVNLRKGGTTAPFLILQYLTDGHYDAESGTFRTAQGHSKCYVSSDHVESHAYRVFMPDDLFDIVSRHRLHFDHTSQTGVLMHMITGVGEAGRVGVTAIHNSPAEAEALYQRFVSVLDEEAAARLKA